MKLPIDVFSDWANDGRDEDMAKGHAKSVQAMLDFSLKDQIDPFTFVDAGCGNGWVVRMLAEHPQCISALGVDGSQSMIDKARSIDIINQYECADLVNWIPNKKVDIVHSMEVFYYVESPVGLIVHVLKNWISSGGRLIMGIDYYAENEASGSWPRECGISIMTRLSKSEWVDGFNKAGFKDIQCWREGEKEGWAGTLVLTGIK